MIILCDVDEVVADLLSEWVRRYNERWNDNLKPHQIVSWDMMNHVKPECGERVYAILEEPDLYDNIQPVRGAELGVKRLREMGEVYFVTSCAGPEMLRAKASWLLRHGFLDRMDGLIVTSKKHLVRGDVLIDDAPHNFAEWKGFGVLFAQPYNAHAAKGPGVLFRAESWKQAADAVEHVRVLMRNGYKGLHNGD